MPPEDLVRGNAYCRIATEWCGANTDALVGSLRIDYAAQLVWRGEKHLVADGRKRDYTTLKCE